MWQNNDLFNYKIMKNNLYYCVDYLLSASAVIICTYIILAIITSLVYVFAGGRISQSIEQTDQCNPDMIPKLFLIVGAIVYFGIAHHNNDMILFHLLTNK